MAPTYASVAVIGSGPALRVKLFERRERVGGTWLYDEHPEPFSAFSQQPKPQPPAQLPRSTPSGPENLTARTGNYATLDSNVGSEVMAFTYKPFPVNNSASSIHRLGNNNYTKPWQAVANYLEEIAEPFSHLISLNTHVEDIRKIDGKWTLTLRRTDYDLNGEKRDYWWQEKFDAVIVATGHYSVPHTPKISGLDETSRTVPKAFEHSKAFRSPDHYVNKKVAVVGGNVSAADIVSEAHNIVSGPLYVSQRGHNEALDGAWNLPNVHIKPEITSISVGSVRGVKITFSDGTEADDIDKVHFATGYRLSYPFLTPDPVAPSGRLAGFYQHVFNIKDPSLAVIGQVKAAISFRVYEYQAVAVARFFAGRGGGLPSQKAQDEWEVKRLQYKGPTPLFHEIKPDFGEYFGFLISVAGPPAKESDGYNLPEWRDDWALKGFAVLQLKAEWWKKLKEDEDRKQIKAKL